MKVDQNVEDRLRDIFAEVVDHNVDGVLPPLQRLNDEEGKRAVTYAMLVINFVMNDVHDGEVDAEVADVMAEDVLSDVSKWLNTELGTRESVAAFLLACSTGDNGFAGVDPDNIVMYAFVIGGDLLSHYRPEGMRWWEYLDQIWNYYESQPDPA